MAKELPYFKYFPAEWVTGDITLCDMETQGVFINICSFYWMRNCSICLANIKQRFSNHEASINDLLKQEIIKVDKDENIIIHFLDEQMNEFVSVSEKRAMAGAKGGKAKAKQVLSKTEAKPSNKEKRRERKEIDKEYKEDIPSFDEFKKLALEHKSTISIFDLELKYKAWKANDWKDGNNKKIINWKSKLLNTLSYIKDDNKKVNSSQKFNFN